MVLEKTLESPLDCKEIQPVHPKGDQSWVFIARTDGWSWNSSTLATSWEELTHWKIPWCWEGLGAGEEGDDRGWDGWMASSTRWTWVWVNSGGWWWTGRPGVLWFMGSQIVGHAWATELNWTELNWIFFPFYLGEDKVNTGLKTWEFGLIKLFVFTLFIFNLTSIINCFGIKEKFLTSCVCRNQGWWSLVMANCLMIL